MDAASLELPRRLPLPRAVLARVSDERLVDEVRRGNERAFEALYDRHHRGLLSFCRHMLGSREDAEDAVQQSFVSAHGSAISDDREIIFKPWLYTIARNRCLSMLRARRESAAGEPPEPASAGLTAAVEQRSELRQLLADLAELPEHQRAALVLFELDDLSQREVAAVLGCEVAKVKSLVYQARLALREAHEARALPCAEVREELATAGGVRLPRNIRRHLRSCPGCTAFYDDVRGQRKLLAALLPVAPPAGLKGSVLSAAGTGGGATTGGLPAGVAAQAGSAAGTTTAAVGGGEAAGGGLLASMVGGAGVAKMATVALAASGLAVGGSVTVAGLTNRSASEDQTLKRSAGGGPPAQAAAGANQPPGARAHPGADRKAGQGHPRLENKTGGGLTGVGNPRAEQRTGRGQAQRTQGLQRGNGPGRGRHGRPLARHGSGLHGARGKAVSPGGAGGVGAPRHSKPERRRQEGDSPPGPRGPRKLPSASDP